MVHSSDERLTLCSIRLTTKERPRDRFLTAQLRDINGSDAEADALFFVVEITNPWFPNSQIGQTIINTIIREYRRGEHSSPLQNFEIALRKTNEVLANIAQTGETDWIGNLHSLIGLRAGPHFYLAQTGKAYTWLARRDKLMNLTEGLEDDRGGHPLSTFTNIMSGTLELGDRLLLGSSLLAETLGEADLKPILKEETVVDVGQSLTRALQARKIRRVAAFILEAITANANEPLTETLYVDQSPNHPVTIFRHLWKGHVLPNLKNGRTAVLRHSQRGLAWTREWLVPRLAEWGRKGSTQVKHHGEKLGRHLTSQWNRWVSSKKTDRTIASSATAGIRVHHYKETALNQQPRVKQSIVLSKGEFSRFSTLKFRLPPDWSLPKLPKLRQWKLPRLTWQSKRPQLVTFSIGLLVLLLLGISAQVRRNARQQAQTLTSRTEALASARAAQQTAERAFVLGQKEAAKTNFLLAMTAAKDALGSPDTTTEARLILNQSQKLFDQLIEASRFEAGVPTLTLAEVPQAVTTIGDQILALHERDVYQGTLTDQNITKTVTLDQTVTAGAGDLVFGNRWFLPDSGTLVIYDPKARQAHPAALATGTWEKAVALSSFGTTLYLLDPDTKQIWKHTETNGVFSEAKPFFVNSPTDTLVGAIDLAIDGDVFVLNSNGAVYKYTRGNRDENWSLVGLPTPWDKIERPLSLMTTTDVNRLYVFEGKTESHPARLLAFQKDGRFVAQLLFPNEWEINAFTWDPVAKRGYVAQGKDIYEVQWDQ